MSCLNNFTATLVYDKMKIPEFMKAGLIHKQAAGKNYIYTGGLYVR